MSFRTCFVIMPIGDQEIGEMKLSATELKQRYDDLIKEAILKANPTLEVVRADEVSAPGMVTSDILTRIMHSDLVVVDVTYPNPNVFYELGLRHACRPGTIIIRDKEGPKIPFDIAHLRFIEYQNTPTGLKNLSEKLRQYFKYLEQNIDKPDNQFLELAKLTGYTFPSYAKHGYTEEDAMIEVFSELMKSPEMLDILMRKSTGKEVGDSELTEHIFKNPDVAITIMKALVKSGAISSTQPGKPPIAGRKKRKSRRK